MDDGRVVRPHVNPMLYISHLCYADDVLLFAVSSNKSARGIQERGATTFPFILSQG